LAPAQISSAWQIIGELANREAVHYKSSGAL